jgi:hypothetical protein
MRSVRVLREPLGMLAGDEVRGDFASVTPGSLWRRRRCPAHLIFVVSPMVTHDVGVDRHAGAVVDVWPTLASTPASFDIRAHVLQRHDFADLFVVLQGGAARI